MSGTLSVGGKLIFQHSDNGDVVTYGSGIPAGTVLQVEYAEEKVVRSTTARYFDSQANFEAIHTDFKIEILPTLSTNYLLFSGSFSVGQSSSTYGVAFRWYIRRVGRMKPAWHTVTMFIWSRKSVSCSIAKCLINSGCHC